MELENDIKTHSYFVVDMDPDKLTKVQNALQLAKAKTLPGQHIFIPIAPGIAFRYSPKGNSDVVEKAGLTKATPVQGA